jgi:sulfur-oxidizing protein SoxB
LIESDHKYVVGGWASVSEDVEGPAIYDLVENYITKQGQVAPKHPGNVRVIGM